MVQRNQHSGRLSFSSDVSAGIRASEIIIIVVGTPMREDGYVDLSAVRTVSREIGKALNGPKIIVSKSTVPVDTGELISSDLLQTYEDALKRYPYKQESKFLNGEAFDRGTTEPRHVIASDVHYIGKEADRWEEDFLIGLGFEPMTKFGSHPRAAVQLYTEIRMAVRIHRAKPVADATGLARSLVDKISAGIFVHTKVPHDQIQAGLRRLTFERLGRNREQSRKVEAFERAIKAEGGVRAAAIKLGEDPSNMLKAIARFRARNSNNEDVD